MKGMKGIKRVLVFLLIAAMVMSMAACGGGGDGDKDKGGEEITLSFATSVYVEEPHQKAIDALVAAYEDTHPNVKIEIYGSGYANYWDNVTTEIMGNNEADIMQVYPENVASYNALRDGGVFVDLNEYIGDKDYKTQLTGQDMCEFDGQTLALSNYAWGTTALFYRKSILNDAGIDANNIKTWNDFVAASRTLKEKGIFGMGVLNSSHAFVVSEWARMVARPVSDGLYFPNGETGPFDSASIQVNSPENVWAAKEWQNYLLTEQLGKGAPDKKDSREYFWNGVAAFNYDGPWFVGMCKERDDVDMSDIGIIPAPAVEYNGQTYKPNPTMYPLVMCLSKNCENPEAAWEFMEWMTSDEAQKLAADCGMIPASVAYSGSDEYKEAYPESSLFADFLQDYAPQVSDPFIAQQGELNQIMINACQKMFTSGEDAQKTLDAAAAECKAVMDK